MRLTLLALTGAVALGFTAPAPAQSVGADPAPVAATPSLAGLNPLSVLDEAGAIFAGSRLGSPLAPAPGTGDARAEVVASGPAPLSGLSTSLNILVLLSVVTLVPSIMLMTTCFIRIIVVLGLLKQALGTNTLPPSQVILGLSLFMTLLVMTPTLERIHAEAIVPHQRGEITDHAQLWNAAKAPLRDFMFDQIEATGNWSSVYMVLNYRGVDTSDPSKLTRADVDMISLIPAFMLSELKTAFLMGFRIYLPFLVVDMVIACLLISMSMMMLPPVLISLPFKLLLFVMVDGWQLVAGSLMSSFVTGAGRAASLAGATLGVPGG